MTENYPYAPTPPQRGEQFPPAPAEEQGTADVVKSQTTDLSHSSIQTGKHVADVAREQASGVAAEAARQGRDLLHQAQGQLEKQAVQGQQQLAHQLLSLSDELRSMAGASGQDGMAASLASQAASRVRTAGQWLDDRQPAQVADEMQSFARRRPAVFLALAVGAGLVVGRLTRGLKDANSDNSAAPAAAQEPSGQWAQRSDVASYPPASGDPAWQAGPVYGERSPLVVDDQTARQGTL